MAPALRYGTYILAGLRNKLGRNLGAAFCFALIAANVFSGQYLVAGEVQGVGEGVERMGADLLVVPAEYTQLLPRGAGDAAAIVAVLPSSHRFEGALLAGVGEAPGVVGVSPQLYAGAASIPELASTPIDVYGIDPGTDFTIRPWVRAPADGGLEPGRAIVGSGLGRNVGDVVPIASRNYVVAGVLAPTQTGIDRSVFLAMQDARAVAPEDAGIREGQVSAGLVRLAKGTDPEAAALELTRLVSPANLSVVVRHAALDPVSQGLAGLPGFLNLISAVVLVAAFPLIALIAAMVANERQREIGLLRAMGARGRIIAVLVMAESLALAALGAVGGVVASLAALSALAANGALSNALQVSFRTPAAAEVGAYAAVTFLVVIAMATLASAYPAYRSSTMNPFDAIRQDGA